MTETVAFGSTVHSQKKHDYACAGIKLSQSIALDSRIHMSCSACHDALLLTISNEHQATTDMFIVFVGDFAALSQCFINPKGTYHMQIKPITIARKAFEMQTRRVIYCESFVFLRIHKSTSFFTLITLRPNWSQAYSTPYSARNSME